MRLSFCARKVILQSFRTPFTNQQFFDISIELNGHWRCPIDCSFKHQNLFLQREQQQINRYECQRSGHNARHQTWPSSKNYHYEYYRRHHHHHTERHQCAQMKSTILIVAIVESWKTATKTTSNVNQMPRTTINLKLITTSRAIHHLLAKRNSHDVNCSPILLMHWLSSGSPPPCYSSS